MLGTQELATLLSTDRTKQMAIIQNDVNTEAKNFGIEIVDVRIKRADLPPANSGHSYHFHLKMRVILQQLCFNKLSLP